MSQINDIIQAFKKYDLISKISNFYNSQGARFLKIDLAQLCSQKRFDFRNSKNYPSTTFLGTSYSQIVVAVFQEESFCTPTPILL